MKPNLLKPNYRTVIDLGLRPVEQRNEPKRLLIDELKGLGLIWLFSLVCLVITCLAIVTLGKTAAMITLLATFVIGFFGILKWHAQRRSSMVYRVRPDGTNNAIWIFVAIPIVFGLLAVLTRAPVVGAFALVSALFAVYAWRRRGLAPAGLRAMNELLAPDETTLGDGFAADKSRKLHGDCWKIMAVTDRRLLIGTFGAKRGKNDIRQVALNQIAGYGTRWGALGTWGELTLQFKSPFSAEDPRTSIDYYRVLPSSLVSLVDALRLHGIPGPAIEHPPSAGDADSRPADAPVFKVPEAPAFESTTPASRSTRERVALAVLIVLVTAISAFFAALFLGVDMRPAKAMIDQYTKHQLPTDGRSDLTGAGAAITYPAAADLIELETDEDWGEGPFDGARWELRTTFSKGYNVISLANYVFVPRLDDDAAVARFLQSKDAEHADLAGHAVTHSTKKIDGRTAHVWNHEGKDGYWYFAAWFPHPIGTVRLECIAKNQRARFEKMCADAFEAMRVGE